MRIFRFSTSRLALIFSVVIEGLYFAAYELFGTVTEFGTNTNFWSQSYFWFHLPAMSLTDHLVPMGQGVVFLDVIGSIVYFSFASLEWWPILFVAIWCFRHFRRKSV
jgi:hypothetical protein